jgi:hypothetical protein
MATRRSIFALWLTSYRIPPTCHPQGRRHWQYQELYLNAVTSAAPTISIKDSNRHALCGVCYLAYYSQKGGQVPCEIPSRQSGTSVWYYPHTSWFSSVPWLSLKALRCPVHPHMLRIITVCSHLVLSLYSGRRLGSRYVRHISARFVGLKGQRF